MTDWVTNLVESGGYWAIAALMFLENVFPPIPSEVIMPLGGFVAKRGDLMIGLVILAGGIGSVVGQIPLYYLGYVVSKDRVKHWADGWLGWFGVKPNDLDKSFNWFDNHGGKAVFLCRFVPGVRSFISIPAGSARMNLAKFLALSFAGMTIWAAALALAGYWLGANWDKVKSVMGPVSYVVIGLVVVGVVGFVVYRKTRSGDSQTHPSAS